MSSYDLTWLDLFSNSLFDFSSPALSCNLTFDCPLLQKISQERLAKATPNKYHHQQQHSPRRCCNKNSNLNKSLSRLCSLENRSESSIKEGGESCCGSSSSSDRSKEIGRWVELVQRRSLRLVDLRREFQGWQGSHERHCILHDVLLTPWLAIVLFSTLSIYLSARIPV